jgi:hypothetical protein
MCNPNSSVANRRYRQQAAFQSVGMSRSASLLTQKLIMGSMMDQTSHQNTFLRASNDSTPPSHILNNTKPETYEASFILYDQNQTFLEQNENCDADCNVLCEHPEGMVKAKRRRKPQKPGLTAKVRKTMHVRRTLTYWFCTLSLWLIKSFFVFSIIPYAQNQERHFVQHHYHDHANDIDESESDNECANRRRGGVTVSFPQLLHRVLDQVEVDGFAHVISWSPHGRCFAIHKPKVGDQYSCEHTWCVSYDCANGNYSGDEL